MINKNLDMTQDIKKNAEKIVLFQIYYISIMFVIIDNDISCFTDVCLIYNILQTCIESISSYVLINCISCLFHIVLVSIPYNSSVIS